MKYPFLMSGYCLPVKSALIMVVAVISLASNNLQAYCAEALAFSNSFSTRAKATQANYWNPASLSLFYGRELLIGSTFLDVGNNSFSIKKYNDWNGRHLDENDKAEIINDLDGAFRGEIGFSHAVGIAIDNRALTGKFNLAGKSRVSSKYLDLLLHGNKYDHLYKFDSKNNSVDLLAYTDITYGQSLPDFELAGHTIHSGVAVSFLSGLLIVETDTYKSEFSTSDEGINLDQQVVIRTGNRGRGLTSLIGFRSDIGEDTVLSLTIDNLWGFIRWRGDNQLTYYNAYIENAYVASLDEEFFVSSDSTRTTGSFNTTLSPSFCLGAQYTQEYYSFSIDWKQGFTNSVLTSKTPQIGMGLEIRALEYLPLRMGYKPGLGKDPYSLSYGLAVQAGSSDIALAVNTIRSIFPSSASKGLSIALTTKWSF